MTISAELKRAGQQAQRPRLIFQRVGRPWWYPNENPTPAAPTVPQSGSKRPLVKIICSLAIFQIEDEGFSLRMVR